MSVILRKVLKKFHLDNEAFTGDFINYTLIPPSIGKSLTQPVIFVAPLEFTTTSSCIPIYIEKPSQRSHSQQIHIMQHSVFACESDILVDDRMDLNEVIKDYNDFEKEYVYLVAALSSAIS